MRELERDLQILKNGNSVRIGRPWITHTGRSISKPESGPIIIGKKAHKAALFYFKKSWKEFRARVTQQVEGLPCKQDVGGSSPPTGSN